LLTSGLSPTISCKTILSRWPMCPVLRDCVTRFPEHSPLTRTKLHATLTRSDPKVFGLCIKKHNNYCHFRNRISTVPTAGSTSGTALRVCCTEGLAFSMKLCGDVKSLVVRLCCCVQFMHLLSVVTQK